MRILVIGRSRSGTTFLRNILSSHPSAHLTNEMNLYNYAPVMHAEEYFEKISERFARRNIRLPFTLSPSKFVKEAHKKIDSDTLLSRVTAAESIIFQNKFQYYGDKTGTSEDVGAFKKENVLLKIIHIHRDARDSVASSIVYFEKIVSPYLDSQDWASKILEWFRIRESLDNNDFIELKFENFIKNEGMNEELIGKFLDIDHTQFTLRPNKNKAHIGRYKKDIPNWETVFAPQAIELMGKLGYLI